MSNKELHIYGSKCCHADLVKLPEVVIKKEVGSTHYYYNRCFKCGEICDSKLLNVFDSYGVEVKPGDLIEVEDLKQSGLACQYHAAYTDSYGFQIRDLGHNNVGMYNLYGDYFNIGPYWRHLDKLSDEDLDYYWNSTREKAQKLLKKEQELLKEKNISFAEIREALDEYFKDMFKDIEGGEG